VIELEEKKEHTFEWQFLNLIDKRFAFAHRRLIEPNEEYRQYRNRCVELCEMIKEKLGPEHEGLISEYEEIEGLLGGMNLDAAYKVGFRDGIRLQQELENLE